MICNLTLIYGIVFKSLWTTKHNYYQLTDAVADCFQANLCPKAAVLCKNLHLFITSGPARDFNGVV